MAKKKPYKNVDNGRKAGKGGIFPPDNTGKTYKNHQPEGIENRRSYKPEIYKDINFDDVNRLCAIGCTEREVCSDLGISVVTLDKALHERFDMTWKEYFNENNDKFKVSLRRLQFRSAEGDFDEDGNKYRAYPSVPMQIWLGKQFLNQSDKQEQKIEEKTNIPLFDWGTEDAEAEDITNQKEISDGEEAEKGSKD